MTGRVVSPGRARGTALVSDQPLGFYGGVDPKTGVVTDAGHPLAGQCVRGRVLCFPCGKGSTVGSYVLYGLVRNGVAPCAIVNQRTETIVATGAILAGIPCVDGVNLAGIATGDLLEIVADDGAAATVRHV
jgi:hypothetical protein